jgi:hypothetical protein
MLIRVLKKYSSKPEDPRIKHYGMRQGVMGMVF